jgi:hypothetical protein
VRTKKADQATLDFERGESCEYPRLANNDEQCEDNSAVVFSFADKLAEKEEEQTSKLYDGILSRIKHLSFK